MEILQTVTVENINLSVGDSWDLGNGVKIKLMEIFNIDGQIYLATITEGQAMMGMKINKDSEEVITPNRYVNMAEIWVKRNTTLLAAS